MLHEGGGSATSRKILYETLEKSRLTFGSPEIELLETLTTDLAPWITSNPQLLGIVTRNTGMPGNFLCQL